MKRYFVGDDAGLLRDYVAGIVREGERIVNIIWQPSRTMRTAGALPGPAAGYVVISESGQDEKR